MKNLIRSLKAEIDTSEMLDTLSGGTAMRLNEIIKEIEIKVGKGTHCTCNDEDKHGETSIMCCNECGKPTEKFWRKGMY